MNYDKTAGGSFPENLTENGGKNENLERQSQIGLQ